MGIAMEEKYDSMYEYFTRRTEVLDSVLGTSG
jgi:hypothetical protein